MTRAKLVFADGREMASDAYGGRMVIHLERTPTGYDQVTFGDLDITADGVWVYREVSRKDATQDVADAGERNRERSWEVFRRGLETYDDDAGGSWFTRARRRIANWVKP